MKRLDRGISAIPALSMIALGFVIAFSSFAVVRAEHAEPDSSKTFKCTSGTACLQAKSTGSSTAAFVGTATAGAANAIVGTAFQGDGLYASSSYGYGVVGYSAVTAGVFGESKSCSCSYTYPGVYGYSSGLNTGVAGYSAEGTGVYGVSSNGAAAGVHGDGEYFGVEGEAYSGGTALFAQADDSQTYLFDAFNIGTNGSCLIDASANLTCTGTVSGDTLRSRHRASTGERVLAYGSESASATIEDVGRARLFNGVANVEIAPDFASVTDRSGDYYVFLTARGDTHGLYVSMQTPTAFQVRENMHGRSSVMLDYRIVARPIDADGDRLPRAPRMRRAH